MKIQFFNIREKGKLEVDDFKITLQLKKKNKIRISFIHASFKCLQKKILEKERKSALGSAGHGTRDGRGGEGEKEAEVSGSITRGEREREREIPVRHNVLFLHRRLPA